jgi:hypothetical protein
MIREHKLAPDNDVANAAIYNPIPVSYVSLSPSAFSSRSLKLKMFIAEIQGKGKHLDNKLAVSLHSE